MLKYEIGHNDILIHISPSVDANCNWTGEINVDLIESKESSLCEDDHDNLLLLSKAVCASIPMYEDDVELYDKALSYIAMAEDATHGIEDPYLFEKYTKEGNILNVNFSKVKK